MTIEQKPIGHGGGGGGTNFTMRDSAGQIVPLVREVDAEKARLEFNVRAAETRLADAKEQLRMYCLRHGL